MMGSPNPKASGPSPITLTVSNNGPNEAKNVVVADGVPAGLAFESAAASAGIYNDGTGVWTVGDLANGASETLMIIANRATGGEYDDDDDECLTVTNKAEASSDTVDLVPGNNEASATLTLGECDHDDEDSDD